MATLGELIVKITGNDRPFNATADKVRRSLTGIDRTKVEPSITMPEKPVADIEALSKRLQSLGRQKVNLNVSSTLASAEVKTLGRQLETLQSQRVGVPVALQGGINAQIAKVQAELAAAEKKQTRLPLQLERIDDQVAAVRAKLATLNADVNVDVPVKLSGFETVKAHLAAMARDRYDTTIRVSAQNAGGGAFDPVALLKIPALLAAVNVAGSALSSLGAGAVSLTSALLPAAGALAVFPVALAAIGQGAGVVKLGLSGVGDVMKAQADMQARVASGVKVTAAEQAKYNQVLKDAGPASVAFATQLGAAQSGLDGVRRGVQNALLPQLGQSLGQLSGTYLPVLKTQLVGTATVLGGFAERWAWALTSQVWVRDLNTIMSANTRLLGTLGGAALPLANILRNIWVAALPLTERFAKAVQDAAFQISIATTNARNSGALTAFFKTAGDTAAQLGRILGGLTVGLFNVFRGGYTQGKGFLDLFETLTARFAAWTGTLAGKNAIADFFARAQPVLNETGRLIATVVAAFGAMSTQADLAPVIAQIRTQLLPVLQQVVSGVDSKLLPALVSLATSAGKVFAIFTGSSGQLTITVNILRKAGDAFLWLNDHVPGVSAALSAFFVIAGARQGLAIVSQLTGLSAVIPVVASAFGILRGSVIATQAPFAAQAIAFAAQKVAALGSVVANSALSVSLRAVGAAVYAALGPFGLIAAALVAVVSGVIYAYKNFAPFRNAVNALGAAIMSGLAPALTWLKGAWSSVVSATVSAWASIKGAVSSGWQAITGFFSGATNAVVTPITGAWTSVRNATSAAWVAIRTAVSSGWAAVVGFFRSAGALLLAPILAAWTAVRTATGTALAAVAGVIKGAIGLWISVVKVQVAIIGTVVLLAFQAMKAVVTTAMDGIRVVIAAVWRAIGPTVTAAVTGVRNAVKVGWDAVKAVTSAAWQAVRAVTTAVWTAVASFISSTWRSIRAGFTAAMAAVRAAFSAWWSNLQANAVAVFTAVKNFLSNTWAAIRSSVFGQAMAEIRASFRAWWSALQANAVAVFNAVRAFLSNTWAAIRSLWSAAMAAVRSAFATWWNNLRDNATALFNAIRSMISNVWGAIRTLWSSAQSAIRATFDSFWNGIKSTASAAINNVRTTIDGVFGRIRSGTQSFVDAVGRIFSGIKNAFSAPWEWVSKNVFGRIAAAYNTVAKLVGAQTINLADGGVAGNPTGSRSTRGGLQAAADGGLIRGRGGPRQDNIAGIDRRTGVQTSWVSAKEFVVNARSTEANRPLVEALNAAHGPLRPDEVSRMFAGGGFVPGLFAGGATPHPGPYRSHGSNYYGSRVAGDFGSGYGGTPNIKAWKAGIVAAVQHLRTSYGNNVRVNHPGSNEWTRYAHMSSIGVDAGQRVGAGQTIGRGGWSGNVQPRGPGGAHLHFEIHGGTSSTNSGKGDPSGDGGLLSFIKPRAMFTKIANGIIGTVSKGMSALGIGLGDTPSAQMIGKLPSKMVDLLAGKLPVSFGSSDGGGGDLPGGGGAVGSGRAAIRSAMLRYGANSVGTYPGHQPTMMRAWDAMISNKSQGDRIAGHLAANRGKYGIDYLIWNRQMLRSYDKGSIKAGTWAPYFDGQSSNPSRAHTNHVHASFADGGRVGGLADGGIVKGGRGGVTSRIGEGRFDELVTPLPRNWSKGSGSTDAKLDKLIALLEERGAGGVNLTFETYNPVAETQSVTTNKALQRVSSLGLV